MSEPGDKEEPTKVTGVRKFTSTEVINVEVRPGKGLKA